ncbi:MAG: metal ABC transporter permease [Candidatus Verstraetearchaeota archaeon]|nr:metal ABC transporter permease [Candidatus Verstraetearchaeota archaeon]
MISPSVSFIDLLGYQFFQHAILGGVLAAFACGWIGLFLVLRREAMIVDGVAHTAFGGIALGLFFGIDPVLSALAVSIIGVFGISYLRNKGLAQSDSATAVMLALGFSAGLIVVSLAGGFSVDLFSYLFGSILSISRQDLALVSALAVAVLAFLTLFHKELLAITFDEESSRMMGIPVKPLSAVFNLIVAVTIILSIRIIGIILVVALIVLPALAALQLRLPFRETVLATVTIGVLSTVVGIIISSFYNVATSGVIVFTMVGIYLLIASYARLG